MWECLGCQLEGCQQMSQAGTVSYHTYSRGTWLPSDGNHDASHYLCEEQGHPLLRPKPSNLLPPGQSLALGCYHLTARHMTSNSIGSFSWPDGYAAQV